jgi:hypothetical protein
VSTEDQDCGPASGGRSLPPAYKWPELADGELELIRKRQRARARIVALLLGAFVVLLFFITIAKTGMNW